MDKQNITTIREDLANDFYPLAMTHSDEIRKMLEEFEDDQLLLAMELEDKEGGCNGQSAKELWKSRNGQVRY